MSEFNEENRSYIRGMAEDLAKTYTEGLDSESIRYMVSIFEEKLEEMRDHIDSVELHLRKELIRQLKKEAKENE